MNFQILECLKLIKERSVDVQQRFFYYDLTMEDPYISPLLSSVSVSNNKKCMIIYFVKPR